MFLFDICKKFYKFAQMDLSSILKQLSSLPTFVARKRLCDQNFQKLNSGSARIIYLLPDGRVLKLAKNEKGLAQNDNESATLMQTSITNKMLETDPNNKWLITSLAKKVSKSKFQSLSGINFDEFKQALEYWAGQHGKSAYFSFREKPENYEKILNNGFFQEIIDLIGTWNMGLGDLLRLNSYGEVNGKLILIDFGLTEDIFQKFYKRK